MITFASVFFLEFSDLFLICVFGLFFVCAFLVGFFDCADVGVILSYGMCWFFGVFNKISNVGAFLMLLFEVFLGICLGCFFFKFKKDTLTTIGTRGTAQEIRVAYPRF